MEYDRQKVSSQMTTAIAKIDQLLRLYQMSKKSDSSKKTIVEKKVNDLLSKIKHQPTYSNIQTFLTKKIQAALDDTKVASKVQRQVLNSSTIKSSKSNVQQKKIVSEASVSVYGKQSEQKSKNPLESKVPAQFQPKSFQTESQKGKVSTPAMVSEPSYSQVSNQKSEDNGYAISLQNLRFICQQYHGKSQEILSFNEDIFGILSETEDNSLVYLFGVNNPEKKTSKKLYICTIMKFSSYEIFNVLDSNGELKYQKQNKLFENNLRSPMGFIMCGKSINEVSIEHLKFLGHMKSPMPVIILLNSFKQKNGVLYQFSEQTMRMSLGLNKIQFETKTKELRKDYASKQKSIQKIQVVKDKLVITKNLTRAITTSIQSAQNAIQIESSNECIKEEQNRFPYKLHSKYYVSPKSDYQLFFLDNQLVAFKMNFKEKQFDGFKKFVLEEAHLKGTYLMSTSVLKETSEIKKDFWKLLVLCKTRDQYFLVNLSGITNKKTIILSLKQGVTEDQIMEAPPFLFKDLEQSTNIINLVAVITKSNYKQFETESKVDVIDLTIKKK